MANTSASALAQVSGVDLNVTTKTATFNTDGIGSLGKRYIGCQVTTAGSGGTSPTLDVTPEISFDGGTVWDSLPEAANSQTAAALGQITGNGVANAEYWNAPLPVNANCQYRFKCTIGGTSPTFNITFRYFFSEN